jgi:maleate cis-trans isomerase
MTLEYAPRGLIGILTPQANTTVEPEMAIMIPPGFSSLTARLCSAKPSMNDRLRDYFDTLSEALRQFANAPLSACGFACTGASYLVGAAREDMAVAALSDHARFPVVTAAGAIAHALRTIGAERIALLSPYDDDLHQASATYWTERGFQVADSFSVYRHSKEFHPIYSLPSDETRLGLERLAPAQADVIVVLGTGLPSLTPVAATPRVGGKPVLSSMLCLAWRTLSIAGAWPGDRAGLQAFLDDHGWRSRLTAMRG